MSTPLPPPPLPLPASIKKNVWVRPDRFFFALPWVVSPFYFFRSVSRVMTRPADRVRRLSKSRGPSGARTAGV